MMQALATTQPAKTNTTPQRVDTRAARAYLASLKSETGRRAMTSALRKVARVMGAADIDAVNWASLNAANVKAIIAQVSEQRIEHGPRAGSRLAPASVATVLNALKGVAKAAWERESITTDTWERIRDVKPPKGSRLPAGRDVDAGERAALIQVAAGDTSPAGARDTAMLAMLIATGMRRGEVVALRLRDVDLETGRVRVVGKGDKERTAYLRNGAMRALRDWLAVRGQQPGALFCVINKGGAIYIERHMTTTALHFILQKRAAEAGVTDLTAHDFRRTFAGELLDAGQDISTVAAMLGHADVKTTAKYDRRGERAKENAAAFISVPYYGRQSADR
jgi:site-specific recombinase XerD